MLIGPVFSREVAIAPRRTRVYFARAAHAGVLLLICWTAWLLLTGTQRVRDVGDLARFGTTLFQILAALQLVLVLFLSALLAAGAVAQEKDRKTLVLLLLTRLTNSELVLGRLLASLLHVLVMLAAALPVFMMVALLGGVSHAQIARVFAVTVATVLVCGALGSTLALWREKTFQALALTILALMLWIAGWTLVDLGTFGPQWMGISCTHWAAGFSPWHAILAASRPVVPTAPLLGLLATPVHLFLAVSVVLASLLAMVSIARVRAWNQSVELRENRAVPERPRRGHEPAAGAEAGPTPALPDGPASVHAERQKTRRVWDNPVIWREICTWAYGRRILVVRLVYLVLFGLAAGGIHRLAVLQQAGGATEAATALIALLLLSLVLVNAQAVTSMTTERDGRSLDLLLVTDLSPKEIIFGKLGGVFYNTKEMVVLPVVLCGYLGWAGILGLEATFLLVAGLGHSVRFCGDAGHSRRHALHEFRSCHCDELGDGILPVHRCGYVHLADDRLQRFVSRPVHAVLCVDGGRRHRSVQCTRGEESVDRHRHCVVCVSLCDVLRDYKLSSGSEHCGVPGDCICVWICYVGPAGACHRRVRRGDGPYDGGELTVLEPAGMLWKEKASRRS